MNIDQTREMCEQRASIYRLLASLVDQEVNKKTRPMILQLRDTPVEAGAPEGERKCAMGLRKMASCVTAFDQEVQDCLACDFARVFLASGRYQGKAAVPYESIYTSEEHILMQEARDQTRAIYRSAHVMPSRDQNIPEDYLPFEFEFMAIQNDRLCEALSDKDAAGAAIAASCQADFLANHLLNWVEALLEDVNRVATTDFYHALADVISGFLACEAQDVPELARVCALPVAS